MRGRCRQESRFRKMDRTVSVDAGTDLVREVPGILGMLCSGKAVRFTITVTAEPI